MKRTALATGLMVVVGALGCKMPTQMAWWKSEAKAPETTALVNTAPALPSDIAKQAAPGAQPSAAQVAGGAAAPFVPGQTTQATASTAPAIGYPSTGAPKISPEIAGQVAASTPAASPHANSPSLGTISTPYDPAKPPKSAVASTTPAAAAATASRYAASPFDAATPASAQASTLSYGQAPSSAPKAESDVIASTPSFGGYPASSRYADTAGAAAPTAPAANAVADFANRYGQAASTAGAAANSYVDTANRYASGAANSATATAAFDPSRYASATTPASAVSTAPSSTTPSNKTVAVAVAGQPYRPGGTSTYPVSTTGAYSPSVQVASRPQESTSNPKASSTVPNVAVPGTSPSTTPSGTTTPPRYW